MKINEISFDSFIILETEEKKSKSQNLLKGSKKNLTEKKNIKNKLLGIDDDILNSDNINNEEEEENEEIINKKIKNKKKVKSDGFINITNFSKEKPNNFEAEIVILNYKKNISYLGKINIYENFEVIINLEKKNALYFNDNFYKFSLL